MNQRVYRSSTFLCFLVVCSSLFFIEKSMSQENRDNNAVYFSDFKKLEPQSAISEQSVPRKWLFRADADFMPKGIVLHPPAGIESEELSYSPDLKGNYNLYVGMRAVGQRTMIQLKISEMINYVLVELPITQKDQNGEILWAKNIKMDGQKIIIYGLGYNAYLGYLKFVPVESDSEIKDLIGQMAKVTVLKKLNINDYTDMVVKERVKEDSEKAHSLLLMHFDEASGNPKDSSGSGNNGTMEGDVRWLDSGKSGAALEFGGKGYVNLGPNIKLKGQNFSIEAWVKTGEVQLSPSGTIISNDNGGVPFYNLAVDVNNRLVFSVRDSESNLLALSDINPINDNQWHHVKIIRQGEDFTLYRDNKIVATKSKPSIGMFDTHSEHWVGAIPDLRGGRWFFRGMLDEISISTSQIEKGVIIPKGPIPLGKGPHLFLDDYLIEKTANLKRIMHQPKKFEGNPIFEGAPPWDRETAGRMLYDAEGKILKRWYMPHSLVSGFSFGYAEARIENLDKVNWSNIKWDKKELKLHDENNKPILKGIIPGTVLYDSNCENPVELYKMFYWANGKDEMFCGKGVSPDGINWEFQGKIPELSKASDILMLFYDRLKKEYVGMFKMWSPNGEFVPINIRDGSKGFSRRLVGMSQSKDFKKWTPLKRILQPDENDHAKLEFYCMVPKDNADGTPRVIGFVPILIDDVKDAPPDGIGWTQLAVSMDFENWVRFKDTFLPRSENTPEAYDHSVAWVDSVLDGDEKTYIFYNAYQGGHKIGKRTGALAIMRRNGYASLQAGTEMGDFLTKQLLLPSGNNQLILNATVQEGGSVLVQLSNGKGIIPGYSFADCNPVTLDSVSTPVSWGERKNQLPATREPCRLEFRLINAALYEFSFK